MRYIPRRVRQSRSTGSANRSKEHSTSDKSSGNDPRSAPGSIPHAAVHKASLSPTRHRLLELLQWINFGSIENLVIRDGEPVLDPPPSIHRDIKFGGENGPRPELGMVDGYLKKEHIQLFALFNQLRNGTIEQLDVQHGLPFHATVKEDKA
jgi:hypothetical protein